MAIQLDSIGAEAPRRVRNKNIFYIFLLHAVRIQKPGNLVLRHYVPKEDNSRVIGCWVAEFDDVLYLVTRASLLLQILNIPYLRIGIEHITVAFIINSYTTSARNAQI